MSVPGRNIGAGRPTAAIVLALLLLLVVCAATARAAPLSMTFTEARSNVGIQLSISNLEDALFRAPDTAPFAAQIDPGTGSIAAGTMDVPDFETFMIDPIDAFVTVDFDIGVISGSFNQATGALSLSGTAGGTLTANGRSCTVSTTPAVLALTTAGTTGGASPLAGIPFTSGLTGAGTVAGQWTDMHAAPVTQADQSFCNNVDARIGGPGGVWLEHEGDSVPPARVAAGGFHSCAIKADDTAACWGNPAVPAGLGTVRQIAAGGSHTCAVKTHGTPVCWGGPNDYGQRTLPAGIGAVRQITGGGSHTCAVKADRTPVCWGDDTWGQRTLPAGIGTVRQIDAGEAHTCAVKTDGTPVCWGDDDFGQRTLPAGIGTVSQISAGEGHTCAVKTDRTPVCWGAGDFDQATVPAGTGTVTQIAAGGLHTCAVKTNGAPVCWGRNAPIGPQPTLPVGIGTVDEIAAGTWHSCAIKADDMPVCWGSHIYGQLGGSPAFTSGPPPLVVGGAPFSHAYTLAPRFDDLPVQFLLGDGELPPGLALNAATGVLSGTPTEEGTFTGTVIATNDVFAPDTQAFSITVDITPPVVPADPGTPTGPGTPTDPGTKNGGQPQPAPKPRACVVPKLAGKTLAGAKKALKAADCKLGKVTKPRQSKGKKRRTLVVKSSSPRRGAEPADGKVDLKLHPKPKPRKTGR